MPSPLESLFDLVEAVGSDQSIRLPDAVLRALRLKPGDRVKFLIGSDGSVRLENPAVARPGGGEGLAALHSIAAELGAQAGGAGAVGLAGVPLLATLLGGAVPRPVAAPSRRADEAAGAVGGEPEPEPGSPPP